MSAEFYIKLEDVKGPLPLELLYLAEDDAIQIGSGFLNGDRIKAVDELLRQMIGEPARPPNVRVEELMASDKPYYSKWDESSPVEFFNTKFRFCWYWLPTEPCRAGNIFDLWDSLLYDPTPVLHMSSHPVGNWGDLKGALYGPDRYMEPSSFIQGTFDMTYARTFWARQRLTF